MATVTVDSGNFSSARLAKSGDGSVTQALAVTEAKTIPLGFEAGIEPRKKKCPRNKPTKEQKAQGLPGHDPDCRVQLAVAADGKSLALRLCHKFEQDGVLIPVSSALEAQAKAKEFCDCAARKSPGVREKCARKVAGSSVQLGAVGNLTAIVRAQPSDVNDWNWEIEDQNGRMHHFSSTDDRGPKAGTAVGTRGALTFNEKTRRHEWSNAPAQQQREGMQPDGTFTVYASSYFTYGMAAGSENYQMDMRLKPMSVGTNNKFIFVEADTRGRSWSGRALARNLSETLRDRQVIEPTGVGDIYSFGHRTFTIFGKKVREELLVWLDKMMEQGF